MGRSPCCPKEGMNRGAWTAIEDKTLTDYIKVHGEGRWRDLPKKAGLKRCGKSCRLRWLNYLRPTIKRGNITDDEEELIIRLHKLLGNRWSLIAGRLPGRTDNEIKNYWNTNLYKKSQEHRQSSATNRKHNNSHSDRCNHQNLEKNNPTTSPPSASKVVHTKATRCTSAVVNSQQIIGSSTTDTDEARGSIFRDFCVGNLENFINNSGEDVVPDLLMDLNMEDFLLSDFLSSDLSSTLPPSSDQSDPVLSSETIMLENWDQKDGSLGLQQNVTSNFYSVPSFLDCEGDFFST